MQIRMNGTPVEVQAGESLLDIVKRLGLDTASLKTRPIAADIAGEVFTLNYIPIRQKEQGDNPTTFRMRKAIRKGGGEIKLIRYTESRGRTIYERTIIYVFFLAMRELFPKAR
jgi:sulfur carrier protein ThiS